MSALLHLKGKFSAGTHSKQRCYIQSVCVCTHARLTILNKENTIVKRILLHLLLAEITDFTSYRSLLKDKERNSHSSCLESGRVPEYLSTSWGQAPGQQCIQRTGSQVPGSTERNTDQTRKTHKMRTNSLRNATAKASLEKINFPFYP